MSTCRRIVKLTTAIIVSLHIAAPGWAAKKESKENPADRAAGELAARKESKEKDAKKACLNGNPSLGVEILTDLYVETNDATYIFNQGRCYEQNERYEDAVGRFREYLRKTEGGSEADRSDAQRHITDCEALVAKKGAPNAGATLAQPPADTTPPLAAAAVTAAPSPSAGSGLALVSTTATPSPAAGGAGMRVAGATAMALGGAGLASGIVLNLKHNSMIKDLRADYNADRAASAQSYETLGWIAYGAGATCLVAGATLYLLGRRAGGATVLPTAMAGGAGALLTGTF